MRGPDRLAPARASALAAALVGVLAGCAPAHGAAYVKAFADAERAQASGRHEIAAARFDVAAKEARLPRDKAYAEYLAAMSLARAGNVRDATRRLDAICSTRPPSESTPEACLRAAGLRIDGGEADRGHADLERLVAEFPDREPARSAVPKIVRYRGGRSKEDALAWIDRVEPALRSTRLAECLSYERAKLLLALGRKEGARDAFVATATRHPYPKGAYFDDALFHAAEIEEDLGRYAEAVALLERMVDVREVASFMGSYQRPRFSEAKFRIAKLYEHKLNDRAHARKVLHELWDEYTTSTLRDDALFHEAALWRKDGDAKTACERLATLARELPDSRWVPCAVALCPGITRAEKSRAPVTCHAYLERPEAAF